MPDLIRLFIVAMFSVDECLSCVASTATSFANNALYQFLSRLLPGVAFDGGGYCAADGTCASSLNKRLCGSVISNAADCYTLGVSVVFQSLCGSVCT